LSDYVTSAKDTKVQPNYISASGNGSYGRFTVALAPVNSVVKYDDVDSCLTTMGIQCVALDVLGLAAKAEHATALRTVAGKTAILGYSHSTDPLSFWAYGGWSYKYSKDVTGYATTQGFVGSMAPTSKLPVYVIPTSVVPIKPPPSTNSNGGLVNIG